MKSNKPRMDKLLQAATDDPSRIGKILPLFQSFATYGNIKPYEHYLEKITAICKKWEDTIPLAGMLPDLTAAYIQFCHGAYDDVRKKLHALYENHDLKTEPEHFGMSELIFGICMRDRGDIDEALVHFFNVIDYLQEGGISEHLRSFAYYFIAEVHMQISEMEEALKYYNKALAIAHHIGHELARFRSLLGLASWYQMNNDHEESMHYLQKALEVNVITEAARARILCDIGNYHQATGDLQQAISLYEESYSLAMKNGYSNPASTSLIKWGQACLELNKPGLALDKLKEALELSLKHKTRAKQMEIETLLARAYGAHSDYEQAYRHLKSAHELTREINTVKQREIFNIKNRMIGHQKEVIESERDRANNLLLNILPGPIAAELKKNRKVEPKRFPSVTVLFVDFVAFTQITEALSTEDLVMNLDTYFRAFDRIIQEHQLEKIKTIGDAYMCAGGVPEPSPDHALHVVKAGLDILQYIDNRQADPAVSPSCKWKARIGIHTGPVIAGVVGDRKFAYDIWGDTVNIASRMESSGQEGKVNISHSTYQLLKDQPNLRFEARGKVNAKNKGALDMYYVFNKK